MTGFTDTQLAALSAPLSREHVKGRKQGGREVSYIEGWHAIAEANRIFGFDAWNRETVECRMVVEREATIGSSPPRPGWRVGYVAKIRITVFGEQAVVVREGTGFGSGIDVDLGAAHESAIKEAETDGMKRALMTFGNPFGLALYDKKQAEVEPVARAAPTQARPPQQQQNDDPFAPPVVGLSRLATEHPRRAEALEAYKRIKAAMNAARTPKMIDELIKANDVFLALIKEVSEPTYHDLMGLSVALQSEMRAAA